MYDLILKNGTLIDGEGTPRFRADLAIEGDRIARIGDIEEVDAAQAIDAADLIVAPGFIDEVASNEVEFSFDVYPYLPGSTMLNYMLPLYVWDDGPLAVMGKLRTPELRARFARSLEGFPLENIHIAWLPGTENARHIGRLLSDYVEEIGRPPAETLADLLIEENLAVLLVFHHGNDDRIFPFLAHDAYMMGTDGIYFPDGAVHPRLYGSAARLLGTAVRDRHLFSLEAAVRKLTGFSAEKFGLKERGVLAEGNFADLVVFDADIIDDLATYLEPHQYSIGVEHVLVNGVPVVSDGQPLEDLPAPRPGRYLKFKQ